MILFSTIATTPLQSDEFQSAISTHLDSRGFAIIPPEVLDWKAHGVDLLAISETMDRLIAAGWPPVFIFLYDQPWLLFERLFDLMGPLLSDEEALLEASMYAWSLERQKIGGNAAEKVGTNFGVPHRDITYNSCHNAEDGRPDILSVWLPLVDVGPDNGCM